MQELPTHLRQEMAVFLHKGVVEKMIIFRQCSVPFLTSILTRVRRRRSTSNHCAPTQVT